MSTEATPREVGFSEGLGPTPLPAPDLQTDPCSSDGTQTDYYTAGTVRRLLAAERERAALVCDDEARIRTEAGNTHPEDSDSRGRCFAAARAAINCAKGVRSGEVVGPGAMAPTA